VWFVGPAQSFDKSVRSAFRPAIAEVTKSTVQVFSDGKRSALGMVVDKDGFVLTKASELKGKLECQLLDGRRAEAKLVGLERKLDVAMLKVEWSDLQAVDWGDEKSVDRGSWIITPGLDKTAPIGVGASGGAGIERVMPKSPAEKAGLQSGDVVTRVGEKEVKNLSELRDTIFSYEPGDEVTLTVRRTTESKVGDQTETKTESFEAKITLGNFQQMIQGERAEFQNSLGGQLSARRAGFPLVLQHDTVLKPQECGGPLVDIDGKVVGVNIARAGRVETYALAASIVKAIIEDMKAGKYSPDAPAEKPAEATAGK
jgi:serine protease Do